MPKRKPPLIADDLLYTKLAPPRAAWGTSMALVSRPALIGRLEAGLARKVTLISAPAGSGKTTLIGEWLMRQTRPVGWVALDTGDNDPVRFWRYVITACRTFEATLGRSALAALRTSQIPSLESVVTSFINELAQLPDRVVLILEDYHGITASEVNTSLAFFIDHLPVTLHLVIVTRSEPALPLARLRVRSELSEFTNADLRFTPAETQSFLREALHIDLPSDQLARLEERTEGWVAGLRLITLALQSRSATGETAEFFAAFGGDQRHVFEYLLDEVISTQPAPLQEFLLQTSALNRLTSSLCDALTDQTDGALRLAQLERANLFLIPLGDDGHHTWYRYHALFAEALRTAARQRWGEAQLHALQAKASQWYEAHALREEAIEMALAAQEFDRAAQLIEQAIEQRDMSELYTLARWAGQLPESVLHAHAALCFAYALVVLFTSDRYAPATLIQLEKPLRVAEEAWRVENNDARLGQVLALRSAALLWQGDLMNAFANARESLELLPEHDVLWRGVSLLNVGMEQALSGNVDTAQQLLIETRALCGAAQNIHGVLAATYWLGETCLWRGEFDQADQLYRQVLTEAVGGEEMLDDRAVAWLGLASIAYERDELDKAEEQAARARDLSAQRSNEEEYVHAAVLLARIQHARAHHTQAQDMLHALAARTQRPLLLYEIEWWHMRLALATDGVETARRWASAQEQRHDLPHIQREQAALLLARVQIMDQKPETVAKLLEPWRVDAHERGRLRSELEILNVQALAYAAQEDSARAQKTLTQALTLAQPKGYRRLFLDQGEPLAQLLQALVPDLGKRPIASYATLLLRAFAAIGSSRSSSANSSPLVEPLSAQEQRVLRLLATGLTNPEIARELVVSTNTIKTQVQSIYRKLNVNSRDEAADLARQLKLI